MEGERRESEFCNSVCILVIPLSPVGPVYIDKKLQMRSDAENSTRAPRLARRRFAARCSAKCCKFEAREEGEGRMGIRSGPARIYSVALFRASASRRKDGGKAPRHETTRQGTAEQQGTLNAEETMYVPGLYTEMYRPGHTVHHTASRPSNDRWLGRRPGLWVCTARSFRSRCPGPDGELLRRSSFSRRTTSRRRAVYHSSLATKEETTLCCPSISLEVHRRMRHHIHCDVCEEPLQVALHKRVSLQTPTVMS